MRWIFSSFAQDFAWLYFPGLLFLVIALLGGGDLLSPRMAFTAIVFAQLCDSGHIYVTAWRTYLHAPERFRLKRYVAAPLIMFPLIYLLVRWDFAFFQHLAIYLLLIHSFRQTYGQMRWYEKLNGRWHKGSTVFFYFLLLCPLLMYHFRAPVFLGPIATDTFHWDVPRIYRALLTVYILGAAAWVAYEVRLSLQGSHEWNRRLAIGVPAVLYAFAAIGAKDYWQALLPLTVNHGFSYIGMSSVAIERVHARRRGYAVALSLLTAAALGGLLLYIRPDPTLVSPLYSLMMTVIFCHYLFDASLWTSRHPEAKLIYSPAPGRISA